MMSLGTIDNFILMELGQSRFVGFLWLLYKLMHSHLYYLGIFLFYWDVLILI